MEMKINTKSDAYEKISELMDMTLVTVVSGLMGNESDKKRALGLLITLGKAHNRFAIDITKATTKASLTEMIKAFVEEVEDMSCKILKESAIEDDDMPDDDSDECEETISVDIDAKDVHFSIDLCGELTVDITGKSREKLDKFPKELVKLIVQGLLTDENNKNKEKK